MSQTRARGLPEAFMWGGSAPWPGLGRSPVMPHGPQDEPASYASELAQSELRAGDAGGPGRPAGTAGTRDKVSGIFRGVVPLP
jgi:hypothetical protein